VLKSFKAADNSDVACGLDHLGQALIVNGDLPKFKLAWDYVVENLPSTFRRKLAGVDDLRDHLLRHDMTEDGDASKTCEHLRKAVESFGCVDRGLTKKLVSRSREMLWARRHLPPTFWVVGLNERIGRDRARSMPLPLWQQRLRWLPPRRPTPRPNQSRRRRPSQRAGVREARLLVAFFVVRRRRVATGTGVVPCYGPCLPYRERVAAIQGMSWHKHVT
jgi:hypothetical protein